MNDPQDHPRNQLREQILPGLWVDQEGNAHFSIPDILAECGIEDTPENRAMIAADLREMIIEETPRAMIVMREKPD